MNSQIPTEIKLMQKQKQLHVSFDDGKQFILPCEYLRVFSPSAEVQGHGADEPKLVAGKQEVNIIDIEPIGNYAVKLIFDDGHDTGLYSWEVLYKLGVEQESKWTRYLQRLQDAGMKRVSVNTKTKDGETA